MDVIQVGAVTLDPQKRILKGPLDEVQVPEGIQLKLTELFIQKPGFLLMYVDIFKHIYGDPMRGTRSILKVYMTRIRKQLKIVAGNHADVVAYRGLGYILDVHQSHEARTEKSA